MWLMTAWSIRPASAAEASPRCVQTAGWLHPSAGCLASCCISLRFVVFPSKWDFPARRRGGKPHFDGFFPKRREIMSQRGGIVPGWRETGPALSPRGGFFPKWSENRLALSQSGGRLSGPCPNVAGLSRDGGEPGKPSPTTADSSRKRRLTDPARHDVSAPKACGHAATALSRQTTRVRHREPEPRTECGDPAKGPDSRMRPGPGPFRSA